MIIQELSRKGDIDQDLARIAERYGICLPVPTFMEFISSLHDSGDRWLLSHQQRLRVVTAPGQGLPLMPPIQYATKHITGVGPNELGVDPMQIATWCMTIRHARSWQDVFAEHPEFFTLADLVKESRTEQKRFVEEVTTSKAADVIDWVAGCVNDDGVPLTRGQAALLAEALSAAYTHVCDRMKHFAGTDTNADKQKGAHFDQLQLWYLTDEDIHWVTNDGTAWRCAQQTVQGARVHKLDDFLRSFEN